MKSHYETARKALPILVVLGLGMSACDEHSYNDDMVSVESQPATQNRPTLPNPTHEYVPRPTLPVQPTPYRPVPSRTETGPEPVISAGSPETAGDYAEVFYENGVLEIVVVQAGTTETVPLVEAYCDNSSLTSTITFKSEEFTSASENDPICSDKYLDVLEAEAMVATLSLDN